MVALRSRSSDHLSVAEFLAWDSGDLFSSTEVAAQLLSRAADGSWPEQAMQIRAADDLVLSSIGFRLPLTAAYRTTVLAGETGRQDGAGGTHRTGWTTNRCTRIIAK